VSTHPVTEDNLESVLRDHAVVALHFQVGWSAPSTAFAPVFERLSQAHSDVFFGCVDLDSQTLSFSQIPVQAPTVMFFRDGIALFAGAQAQSETTFEQVLAGAKDLDMDALRKRMPS
jgi:hypothetical protein